MSTAKLIALGTNGEGAALTFAGSPKCRHLSELIAVHYLFPFLST
jgi:hypothetical protein